MKEADIKKGFKTDYSVERAELRVIYNLVEQDTETFINVLAEMFAMQQHEIEKLETQLRGLDG